MQTMMKVRTIPWAALVSVAVALAVWQATRLAGARRVEAELRAQVAEHAALQEELDRQRQELDLRAEVARLREAVAGIGAAAQPAPSARATPVSTGAAASTPGAASANPAPPPAAEATNRLVSGAVDLLQAAVDFQVKAQLARARERLNLTPAQEEALRGIVDAALATGRENLKRVLSGQVRPEEVPTAEQWGADLERQVLAQLSPDQQAAYQQYKREDLSAAARLAANDEMLRVQSSLGLSLEQQDQVFNALYTHALNNSDPAAAQAGRPHDPVAAFEWQIHQKLKSLEPVLTPVQMETYRQMQEGPLKFVRWLGSLAGRAQPK